MSIILSLIGYVRTNNLLTLLTVGSIKMFKLLLAASVNICDLYLFHFISLLNPDLKLVNNLISSSLDKATTGTYNLQSFIASVAPVGGTLLQEDQHQFVPFLNYLLHNFYSILILKIFHN